MIQLMQRLRSAAAVAAAMAALLATGAVSDGACPGDGPEAVLECFSEAHSNRDMEALESLLAPEYTWVVVAPPEADLFDRERSMRASGKLFADPQVESVALVFEEGYRVVEGKDPRTWRIEDLRATLIVKRVSVAKPDMASMCATLYVREAEGEDSVYEVYREVFFEGLGCDQE